MKTAVSHIAFIFGLLAGGALLAPANAAPPDNSAMPPMLGQPATNAPASAQPADVASSLPPPGIIAASEASDAAGDTADKQEPGKKKKTHGLEAMESGVPDSVKDVVNHLGNGTENITLDDLNSAREAIAKLDALIDIEKRLADLEKLRREREGQSLAGAIPASALNLPNRSGPPMSMPPMPPMPMAMSGAGIEVVRIEGTEGHYMALVKSGGETTAAHVGDHLADGSIVSDITAQGVEIKQNKGERMVRIKDMETVSGNPSP